MAYVRHLETVGPGVFKQMNRSLVSLTWFTSEAALARW